MADIGTCWETGSWETDSWESGSWESAAAAATAAAGKYAAEHASAYADVLLAGETVTFTNATPGTYNGATDTWSTPDTDTVTGVAVRVRGDPEIYRNLSMIEGESPTLLFVPTTYGQTPEPGWTVTWSALDYTARNVNPVAPDGDVIMARVVIDR